MSIFKNPDWLKQFNYPFQKFEEIPAGIFENINGGLKKIQSEAPQVSICISAYNEEVNILRTVASLSKMKTSWPLEIIVVNNNSDDNTQKTLDNLLIKSFFQGIQGWGPARQLGLEKARGKYILLADADCIYPDCWVDEMMKILTKKDVVCVYGRYSFISQPGFPRWKLFMLERMKDVIAEVRQLKRPYLNAYGISMGYVREYGLKVGYVMHKIRGEDGRMCFDLMQFGKIKQVKANKARAWTLPRTLERDGNFTRALINRINKETKRLFTMLTPHPPHDTKTSKNE